MSDKIYNVHLDNGVKVVVNADSAANEEGTLKFYADGAITAEFAPGAWRWYGRVES